MQAQRSSPVGSRWGLFFASTISLGLGLCLGAAELILRPVEVVETLPSKPEALKRFYQAGTESGGSAWREKIAAMAERRSSTLTLSEGEFNTFLREGLKTKEGQAPLFTSNVRILPGLFQIGVMGYPASLNKQAFVFQTSGAFKLGPQGFYFSAQKSYLGSLPLPHAIVQPAIMAVFWKIFGDPSSEELLHSWQEISDLFIENHRLRLQWK